MRGAPPTTLARHGQIQNRSTAHREVASQRQAAGGIAHLAASPRDTHGRQGLEQGRQHEEQRRAGTLENQSETVLCGIFAAVRQSGHSAVHRRKTRCSDMRRGPLLEWSVCSYTDDVPVELVPECWSRGESREPRGQLSMVLHHSSVLSGRGVGCCYGIDSDDDSWPGHASQLLEAHVTFGDCRPAPVVLRHGLLSR